jgi:hypothetical protein
MTGMQTPAEELKSLLVDQLGVIDEIALEGPHHGQSVANAARAYPG